MSPGDAAALEVRGVSVHFGGVAALTGVSLSVAAGTVTGLIGPNGAGKTTLFNVISGLQRPDRGHVLLDGREVTRLGPHRRARLGLARTFQRLELFSTLDAADNVRVGLEAVAAAARVDEHVRELLHQLGIDEFARTLVGSLPTGAARLVEMARALAIGPRVLLLDEPCSGLDDRESAELGRLLQELAAAGKAVLLVEHDMDLVMRVCNPVHVLDFGEVIASGHPDAVRENRLVQAAYLGHSHVVEEAG